MTAKTITRTVRTAAIALLLTFAGTTAALAQAQNKIGHINSQEILAAMPKVQQIQTKIQNLTAQYQAGYKELEDEYTRKLKRYQDENQQWPVAVRKQREEEIMDLNRRMQSFEQDAGQDIQEQRDSLLRPVLDEVQNAIKAVAKENGYSYVFDTSTGAFLYAIETDDISALVRKKLNLPAAPAQRPATGGNR